MTIDIDFDAIEAAQREAAGDGAKFKFRDFEWTLVPELPIFAMKTLSEIEGVNSGVKLVEFILSLINKDQQDAMEEILYSKDNPVSLTILDAMSEKLIEIITARPF